MFNNGLTPACDGARTLSSRLRGDIRDEAALTLGMAMQKRRKLSNRHEAMIAPAEFQEDETLVAHCSFSFRGRDSS